MRDWETCWLSTAPRPLDMFQWPDHNNQVEIVSGPRPVSRYRPDSPGHNFECPRSSPPVLCWPPGPWRCRRGPRRPPRWPAATSWTQRRLTKDISLLSLQRSIRRRRVEWWGWKWRWWCKQCRCKVCFATVHPKIICHLLSKYLRPAEQSHKSKSKFKFKICWKKCHKKFNNFQCLEFILKEFSKWEMQIFVIT